MHSFLQPFVKLLFVGRRCACVVCVCASGARAHIAMKAVISALFLCTSGAQLAAADDAATSPMSLARSLQPASVYPALEETLKAAEAKLDVRLPCVARAHQLTRVLIRVSFLQAYYEKHLAELPKAVAKHTEADKVIHSFFPAPLVVARACRLLCACLPSCCARRPCKKLCRRRRLRRSR